MKKTRREGALNRVGAGAGGDEKERMLLDFFNLDSA